MIKCIYHGNCADGFGAAWVVRKALGDQVQFIPGVYQNPPPDVTGDDVLLVDFSYKKSVILEMSWVAKSITILDHHKSSREDLRGVNDVGNVRVDFDMNRSGAMIAWNHFFPKEDPPQLLLHIQDRDLWKFELPNTRLIQAALFSYPYEFETWDDLMSGPLSGLIEDGIAIERKHFKDIEELLGVVVRHFIIAGYNIPLANLPYTMTSDAGHLLLRTGAPFAGCYWDTPEGRVFSLRSEDGRVDVSKIAEQFGGGGHRNSAGFRISWNRVKSEKEIWLGVCD